MVNTTVSKDFYHVDKKRRKNGIQDKNRHPIFQNRLHIHYLKKLFEDETIPMFSVAVISDKCDISAVTGSHRGEYVFNIKNFTSNLEGLISRRRNILDEKHMKKVQTLLKIQC